MQRFSLRCAKQASRGTGMKSSVDYWRGRCEHARTMSFASMTSVLSKRPVILEESLPSNGVFCMINIAGSSSLPTSSGFGSVPRSDMLFKTGSMAPRLSKGSTTLGRQNNSLALTEDAIEAKAFEVCPFHCICTAGVVDLTPCQSRRRKCRIRRSQYMQQ